ncbi:unnamed protein product [Pleuronectes platessa]|uniref:Uncharacterized protein n=1 Tax=Pleuronectes platessa TaxID=8262 RepID=A0A9N7UB98_PLEPL|nr:unnamed protein product [Pleuronectes platessa]
MWGSLRGFVRQKPWGHNKVSVGSEGPVGVLHTLNRLGGHSGLPLREREEKKKCILGQRWQFFPSLFTESERAATYMEVEVELVQKHDQTRPDQAQQLGEQIALNNLDQLCFRSVHHPPSVLIHCPPADQATVASAHYLSTLACYQHRC